MVGQALCCVLDSWQLGEILASSPPKLQDIGVYTCTRLGSCRLTSWLVIAALLDRWSGSDAKSFSVIVAYI
jgi:hypothetical protein